jgi:hypothetical protein
MAYARFSRSSDVYVYEEAGSVVCLRCQLGHALETRTPTRSAMIRHLEAHLNAGHKVPAGAFDELRSEMEKQGDAVKK